MDGPAKSCTRQGNYWQLLATLFFYRIILWHVYHLPTGDSDFAGPSRVLYHIYRPYIFSGDEHPFLPAIEPGSGTVTQRFYNVGRWSWIHPDFRLFLWCKKAVLSTVWRLPSGKLTVCKLENGLDG